MLLTDLPLWRTVNLWLLPLCYLGCALSAQSGLLSEARLWREARALGLVCLVLALLALLGTMLAGPEVLSPAPGWQLGKWGAVSATVQSDLPGNLFLVMVNLIAWVIIGFSHHYLNGEAGQRRYLASLLYTLAAVNLVVITNNIAVLALAWVMASLALHALLTFYPLRVQALFAAHKKFLVSRLADLCLFGAIGLIAAHTGTLELDQIKANIGSIGSIAPLPGTLQIAAMLLALTAALKCAQLPFHGWLIQVMEAPTPVSALLHAGVVNLGGFLLIRFSFLMASCTGAQIFLVCIGSVTTVIAALVMMTRISIKVALAWSTCAQMGFMLMECGLGAYELAALHVLAHSLYKAYAFLDSGSTNARLSLQSQGLRATGLRSRMLAACVGLLMVWALFLLLHEDLSVHTPLLAFAVIVALALAPLLSLKADRSSMIDNLKGMLCAGGLVLIYVGLHGLFLSSLGIKVVDQAGWMTFRVLWVIGLFSALYLVQSVVLAKPESAFAQRLYPLFYGGFFLDDLFTRFTFWLWPVPAKLNAPNQTATSTSSRIVQE